MMVAPWVLVLLLYGTGMTTIQFETEEACERARGELVVRVRGDTRPFPPAFTMTCVRVLP